MCSSIKRSRANSCVRWLNDEKTSVKRITVVVVIRELTTSRIRTHRDLHYLPVTVGGETSCLLGAVNYLFCWVLLYVQYPAGYRRQHHHGTGIGGVGNVKMTANCDPRMNAEHATTGVSEVQSTMIP